MSQYRVLTGVEYSGKRAEAGAIVNDLPPKSVSWLMDQGIVEKVDGTPTATPKPSEPKKSPTFKGDDA